MRMLTSSILLAALAGCPAGNDSPPVERVGPAPLVRAHAHNDYRHARPLLDALSHGFASVEADIHLVDGELLVAHDAHEVKPDQTLRKLYLEPLRDRAQRYGGSVFPQSTPPARPFILLIDLKTEAEPTYRTLHQQLAEFADMLTVIRDGKVRLGAVCVVISGNRPHAMMRDQSVRYAGVDGRLGDLDRDEPAHLMPMISDRWTSHFKWRGTGPMPDAERDKLGQIVRRAHAKGRWVRFWATPESPAVWQELHGAGVDLINTDQLARLEEFLRARPNPLGALPHQGPGSVTNETLAPRGDDRGGTEKGFSVQR